MIPNYGGGGGILISLTGFGSSVPGDALTLSDNSTIITLSDGSTVILGYPF